MKNKIDFKEGIELITCDNVEDFMICKEQLSQSTLKITRKIKIISIDMEILYQYNGICDNFEWYAYQVDDKCVKDFNLLKLYEDAIISNIYDKDFNYNFFCINEIELKNLFKKLPKSNVNANITIILTNPRKVFYYGNLDIHGNICTEFRWYTMNIGRYHLCPNIDRKYLLN